MSTAPDRRPSLIWHLMAWMLGALVVVWASFVALATWPVWPHWCSTSTWMARWTTVRLRPCTSRRASWPTTTSSR